MVPRKQNHFVLKRAEWFLTYIEKCRDDFNRPHFEEITKKEQEGENKVEEEKKDYGKTLNLPSTDFPMRGNLPENEPKIKEELYDNGLYEKMLKKNEGKTPFVLHDGPPYANGEIHLGHTLNKVLKDTVVRYKNLKGYYTPFIPGFDTHGLPTEKRAIQVLGLNKDEIGVTKFRNTCRDFALGFVQ